MALTLISRFNILQKLFIPKCKYELNYGHSGSDPIINHLDMPHAPTDPLFNIWFCINPLKNTSECIDIY